MDEHETNACVWENRSEIGLAKSFWLTLKGVFLNTRGFVATFQDSGTYWAPVLFGIIAVVIASLGSQVWAELHDWAIADLRQFKSVRMKMILGDLQVLRILCQTASIIMVESLLKVFACHLVMKKLCPGYQGLRVTWAAFFYMSGAAEILYVFPFVGSALAGVSRPILLAVALAEAHRTEMRNALAGVLVIAATRQLFLIALSVFTAFRAIGKDSFTWNFLWEFFFNAL